MRTLGKLAPEIAHRLRQLHHRNHSRNLRALGRVVIDAFSSSHRLPYCSHSPGVRSHASHQKYKRFRRTRNLDRQPIPIKFARPSTFPADLDSAHSTQSMPSQLPSTIDSGHSTPPSDDEVLVRVEGVSKKFCRSLKKSIWYGKPTESAVAGNE